MSNKLTILVDGGFALMSRLYGFEKGFAIENTKAQKQAAANAFKECLSQTMSKIVNQFKDADNIVLMSEGGSWRKQLPIPDQLAGITYKGHREKKPLDWKAIYKAYNEFANNCKSVGITVSQHSAIEGDDWAWYWSRRLNSEGTNVVIWTSDCDLKQLVQVTNGAFTAWYNDAAGLVLHESLKWPEDPIEAMMNPPMESTILTGLTKVAKSKKINYINPDLIAINKILCGDSGDNIKSVVRYQKNGRTYRFANSDYNKLMSDIAINNMDQFLENAGGIAYYIANNPKFKERGATEANIREMIDYNTQLVWLNEAVMPDTVTAAMVQVEYSVFDVNELRGNNELLTNKSEGMADIFAGAI